MQPQPRPSNDKLFLDFRENFFRDTFCKLNFIHIREPPVLGNPHNCVCFFIGGIPKQNLEEEEPPFNETAHK